MRNIRRVIRITIFLVLAVWLHYVLPQRDVARVISTEVIRTDFHQVFNRLFYAQADTGGAEQPTRDLRLINTERVNTYLFGLIRAGRENNGLSQRGYRLDLSALFQVRQFGPAGRGGGR